MVVSIHASVRDATTLPVSTVKAVGVSIHASVRDATFAVHRQCWPFPRFNPRIREGCDFLTSLLLETRLPVSIHASVRDATVRDYWVDDNVDGFNPRIREGCDNPD